MFFTPFHALVLDFWGFCLIFSCVPLSVVVAAFSKKLSLPALSLTWFPFVLFLCW